MKDSLIIDRVEVFGVSLPERREHPMAMRNGKQGDYVIARIWADGIQGLGEATVMPQWGGDHGRYYGEDPALTIRLIKSVLGPELTGADALRLPEAMAKLNQRIKGYPYAKTALSMAMYDLSGRAAGVPVYRLLGGPVRDRVAVAHSIGILETGRVVEEAKQAVAEGARVIKLKVGLDPERDSEIVNHVREAVGPDIPITVDANQGWPDVPTAVRVIGRMAEADVRFVEQPVEGVRELAEVARRVEVPIMADESAWTAADVREIAERRAAQFVSLYTTKPGGLREAVQTGWAAGLFGLRCNVNGSAETGIGNAANLHLAAAVDAVTEACVLPVSAPSGKQPTSIVGRSYLDDIITEPFVFEDGHLSVPSGSGLGVELDEEKLAKYALSE